MNKILSQFHLNVALTSVSYSNWTSSKKFLYKFYELTFSTRSTHICALKGKVEVAEVHIFVQSGI
jgi:hypothetical protein